MAYRSALDAALARSAQFEARVAELEAGLERANHRGAAARGPASRPSTAGAWLLVGATFVAYVVAINLWDGQPPDRAAEDAFARFVAFAPFVASARLWPDRARFAAASGLRLAWLALAWFAPLSRYGREFSLFWHGGLGSVALLAVELFVADAPGRRAPPGRADRPG